MTKSMLAITALCISTITPALAQSTAPSPSTTPTPPAVTQAPTTGTPVASGEFLQQQNPREWRASKLIGSSVQGPDNARIGDINDVVLDANGGINAVVLGVGGILGVGEKEVAVPFKSISVIPTASGDKIDKITVSYTKDQLANAPVYKWYAAAPVVDKRSDLRQ